MRNVGLLGCVGAIVLALIVGGIWFVGVRNNLVGLDEDVNQQWAQVESQYQRRFDLIPNLVRTVQGAANFERSTLEAVTNARARVGQVQLPASAGGPPQASALPNDPNAMANYAAAQQALGGALSRLIAVAEAYPDLKSNQNFLELQSQLEGTENRISVERMRYNEKAQVFNTAIRRFPASLAASFGGFKQKAYFRGAPGSSQAPEVDFNNTPATTTR
jgi:LemA protein